MHLDTYYAIKLQMQTFVNILIIQTQTEISYHGRMNAEFFWEMVKKEVERQRTSFEWLYRKTNISKGTFSSWKSRNIMPRADEAFLIANALKVSLEYLLTGIDQPVDSSTKTTIHEIAEKIPFFDDYDMETLLATVRTMAVRYQNKKPTK